MCVRTMTACVLLAGLAGCATGDPPGSELATGPATAGPAGDTTPAAPRTIVLAFDGLDHGRAQQLMARGELPHLARLHGQRLETLTPVQSPATWAAFNTGRNPGVTGVPGFVTRTFPRDASGRPMYGPLPQPMLGYPVSVPCHDIEGVTSAPYEANVCQAPPWWRHLDAAGVRFLGLQLAMTSPPDEEGPHTRLLPGLGVKDISGSPGSWFVYTDDPWSWEKDTNTAGRIIKMDFDGDGGTRAETELRGPKDWLALQRREERLAALEAGLPDARPGAPREQLQARVDALSGELRTLRRQAFATLPMVIVADREAGRVSVTLGPDGDAPRPGPPLAQASTTLAVGEWSDLLPVTFRLDDTLDVPGQVRMALLRCDAEDVRLYVAPIEHDALRPPTRPPLSAPPEFAAELAGGIGARFHTLGWPAPTNALKDAADSHFDAQHFLDGVTLQHSERVALLDWALEHAEGWDVFAQTFYAPDRIGHLLSREADPEHPAHDAAVAAREVTAFGERFPLGRAVDRSYAAADRVVGHVLDRMESGDLGEDVLLLVVSDHGMLPFRRGVNLNTLLWELGYLQLKEGLTPGEDTADFLSFVDWSRTRAYSQGLGKIYVNLEGREPQGIERAAERSDLLEALAADLLGVTDGEGGPRAITSVSSRDELFDGPWVAESRERTRRWAGQDHALPHWDGFADLFVGFAPGYRVGWANTMGGIAAHAFNDNTNRWSGGHVSVDPSHVPGVLFSNRPLTGVERPGLLDIGPTILARHGVDPAGTDLEGRDLSAR